MGTHTHFTILECAHIKDFAITTLAKDFRMLRPTFSWEFGVLCCLTTPGLRKDIRHQIRQLYSDKVNFFLGECYMYAARCIQITSLFSTNIPSTRCSSFVGWQGASVAPIMVCQTYTCMQKISNRN